MANKQTRQQPQTQWKPAVSPGSLPYGSSAASVITASNTSTSKGSIATHPLGSSGFPAPSMQMQSQPQQPSARSLPGSSGASVITASTAATGRGSVSTVATNSTGGSGPRSMHPQQSYTSVGAPLQSFRQLPQGQSQIQQQCDSFGAPPQTPMPSNEHKQPTTTAKSHKAALYQLYGRKPRRKQLSNDDYLVWNNGGRPHELKFTAIFHCPLTGELFPAARYGDPKYYIVEHTMNHLGQRVEIVWYTKKSLAEHGAACKVLDCLNYREAVLTGNDPKQIVYMGDDAPCSRAQAPDLPPVPPLVGAKIEENNRRVAELRGSMNQS